MLPASGSGRGFESPHLHQQCDDPPSGGSFALSRHPAKNTLRTGRYLAFATTPRWGNSRLAWRGMTCSPGADIAQWSSRSSWQALAQSMAVSMSRDLNITDTPPGGRLELGKRLRAALPRSEHALYEPSPARPDPISLLRRSNY